MAVTVEHYQALGRSPALREPMVRVALRTFVTPGQEANPAAVAARAAARTTVVAVAAALCRTTTTVLPAMLAEAVARAANVRPVSTGIPVRINQSIWAPAAAEAAAAVVAALTAALKAPAAAAVAPGAAEAEAA